MRSACCVFLLQVHRKGGALAADSAHGAKVCGGGCIGLTSHLQRWQLHVSLACMQGNFGLGNVQQQRWVVYAVATQHKLTHSYLGDGDARVQLCKAIV